MIDTLDILRTEDVDEMYEEDFIEHYGILGMHWGIRRTPEQLGHKVSKARERFLKYSDKAEEAGKSGDKKKLTKYEKKAKKSYSDEIKLSKRLDKALKKQVEDDEKIINKGDVDDVLAISHRLSDQQIERAVKRIQNQQKIEGLKQQDAAKVERLLEAGKKVANATKSIADIASNVRTFRQAMDGMRQDEIKAERDAQDAEDKAKADRHKKTLDKIVREADLNKVMKHKEELSTEQIDEAYKRLYQRNKEVVDAAALSKDKDVRERWAYLMGYSNVYKK